MTLSVQAPPVAGLGGEYGAIIADLAPWFHNIHLPNGEQTAPNHPLGDFPASKWRQVAPHLPTDLKGTTALDIGCNAGFYSIELARRGATVFGIDHDEHYLRQAEWAAGACGVADRIRYRQLGVYALGRRQRDFPDTFDLVLFMGVFYHLRYPLLGLDLAVRRAGDLFVFQTLETADQAVVVAPDDLPLDDRRLMDQPGWPRMAFIEHSLASDPTNWWAPNSACCAAMLRSAGLTIASRPGHEIYLCRKARPGSGDRAAEASSPPMDS
ncbi:MAG TPA: TIGR04290 family methyltransferase [Phycisphaerales bacterium]|nr:TIGR04290 family methyltransferase [Phycisphaerales bacterium]